MNKLKVLPWTLVIKETLRTSWMNYSDSALMISIRLSYMDLKAVYIFLASSFVFFYTDIFMKGLTKDYLYKYFDCLFTFLIWLIYAGCRVISSPPLGLFMLIDCLSPFGNYFDLTQPQDPPREQLHLVLNGIFLAELTWWPSGVYTFSSIHWTCQFLP